MPKTATPEVLPGRSVVRGEVTLAELRSLTKRFDQAEALLADDMIGEYDALLVEGDLTVAALDTFASRLAALVVTGDLRVEGTYKDYGDPATGVFVLGNMHAENLITEGSLGVGGDVTVAQALVGFYNDYSAVIHGTVSARVFVPENHYFEVGKKPRFELVLGDDAASQISKKIAKPLEGRALRDAVVIELLAEGVAEWEDEDLEGAGFDDVVEYRALLKHVSAGKPVLR